MSKTIFLMLLFIVFAMEVFGAKEYSVPYPPFSPGLYPCSQCHADMPKNKKKRVLKDMHQDIKIINHGEKDRWCYHCHNENNLDTLKLAAGEPVKFQESYKLCGQCHGNVYEDWKRGIHGKRSGSWNGEKKYLLCVHCHNPHVPVFKSMKPEPAPIRPDETLLNKKTHGTEKSPEKSH